MPDKQDHSHPSNNSGGNRYQGQYPGQLRYNGDPFPQEEDEIDLRRLFSLLWRRKWLIVSVTLLFTILAGAYAWQKMPIYKSTGTMLIKSPKGQSPLGMGSSEGIGSMLASSYGIGMGSTIKNELQIIQSRSLSDSVAQKLIQHPLMKNGNMYPILWREYPNDSTITTQDTVASRLRKRLQVSRVGQETDVVEISVTSPSPRAAAQLVDMVMSTYQRLSTENKRRQARAALDFLTKERRRIKKELHRASEKLRAFMNKKDLVKVDEQAKELIKTISELEAKKQEIRGKLVAARSGLAKYKQQLDSLRPGIADTYAEGLAPKMSRYQYQLAELETKKMLMLQKNPQLRKDEKVEPPLRKLNEKIKMLKERINKQAKQLLNQSELYLGFLGSTDGNLAQDITRLNRKLIELRIEESQYEAQLEVLNKRLEQQRAFFQDLPDNMIHLARLKRDVRIKEKLYNTVSQQYAEMKLWKQTQFGLGRPIDHGFIPEKPVEPQTLLYLVVGFLLGGVASVGFVFASEAFNTQIDGAEKLEDRFYPLLAVIPDIDPLIEKKFEGRDRVTVQDQDISTRLIALLDNISPEAEAFRRLANNILYADPDEEHRAIMVTSSTKGEGKTTIAANLAAVMAEANKKVALVDVDFRRPYQHKFFGTSQSPGVIEHMFEEAQREDIIRSTVMNNVDLVTTGRRPPNPAAVNQSDRLQTLINDLKQEYDHVILDTAPYGIITDAAPMTKVVDGILVVTRFGMTHEAELDQTLQSLERIKAPIIGTILTAFQYEKSSDYYYSSNYYRYAYRDYYRYHEET